MSDQIEAILFDMGGTLRRTVERDDEGKQEKLCQIIEILGADIEAGEFARMLTERAEKYRLWSNETLKEMDEVGFWTRWMLPDWPVEVVSENALVFNRIWRDALGERIILPEARDVIVQLFRRGYRLGLVSNTMSSEETPKAFEDLGISGCFEVFVLSCQVGICKPDPAILLNATERMGVDPAHCVYVGDNPQRDVVSARKAGFAKSVLVKNPRKPHYFYGESNPVPDHRIENLLELLGIFHPLAADARRFTPTAGGFDRANGSPRYDASISTMWGIKKFPRLDDFFVAAGRIGFSQIELNHTINSDMLAGMNLEDYPFSSIHEPCPADIPVETLKAKDWLISSPDEDCRQQGVAAVKRSLDLAHTLGIKTVVAHAGSVQIRNVLEGQMRALYETGQTQSSEYLELKEAVTGERARLAERCLASVKKSLLELLEYSGRYALRLGLENRYYYFDIPTQDEMEQLLALADPERLGLIFDVGHAQAMDRLGFFPYEQWLQRFADRIFGVHFHDVIGIHDHYAPGRGEVDYRLIAGYLPKEAFRTLELLRFNDTEHIKNALKVLAEAGCVDRIQ